MSIAERTGVDTEPPIAVEPAEASTEVLLGRLASVLADTELLTEQVRNLKQETNLLVSEARERGVPWTKIGEVAGVKPQTAYQKYTEKGREQNRDKQRRIRQADDARTS